MNTNKLRAFSWLLALVMVALLLGAPSRAGAAASPTAGPQPAGDYYFNFDDTTKPWSAATDLTAGASFISLERLTGDNGCPDLHGNAYARLKNAPAQTDPVPTDSPLPIGTWMELEIMAYPGDEVLLTFAARDVTGVLDAHPITYIGADFPTRAYQFDVLDKPLQSYWQQFSSRAVVNAQGVAYVAIGWNGADGAVAFDCVSIAVRAPAGNVKMQKP